MKRIATAFGSIVLTVGLTIPALPAGSAGGASLRQDVRFVPDVVGQFEAFSERAEAIGFGIGSSHDPSVCRHYQGVTRSETPGVPYLFVTHSGNTTSSCPLEDSNDDYAGELLVVEMTSRGQTGERLRSNRLAKDTSTTDSPPPVGDTTVAVVHFDGSEVDGKPWPNYRHAGGMQLVGDVLAVALEGPFGGGPASLIAFIDVSQPVSPKLLSTFAPTVPTNDLPSPPLLPIPQPAGVVGLTPLASGRFLMLVTGGDNSAVAVYQSDPTNGGATDLSDPGLTWGWFDGWTEAGDEADLGSSADWPTGAAHQTLNFVRQGSLSGPLYLFGARNTTQGAPFGQDWIDLYRVEIDSGQFKLRWEASRHLLALGTPTPGGGEDIANFAAASGVYVSPAGELLFYATEHDNDGPVVAGRSTVKAGEWRHQHMTRPGSSALDPGATAGGPYIVQEGATVPLHGAGAAPLARAWIELFADAGFDGPSVVVDYPDRFNDNFDDFKGIEGGFGDTNGFSDDASAWRWFAPVGCTVRANDDDFADGNFPGEHTKTLFGTGHVEEAADLDDVPNDDDTGDMNGEITSVEFFSDCEAYYSAAMALAWDLDVDGAYESPGGDVVFSAAALDGPVSAGVRFRAIHPTDGRAGTASAPVQVVNVAPTVGTLSVFDSLGQRLPTDVPAGLVGLPVTIKGTFDDAGLADTHTATISWGDGTTNADGTFETFTPATGSAAGKAVHTHHYGGPGTYQVGLSVTDDDGGTAEATIAVQITDPSGAMTSVLGKIDALIGATTNPAILKELRAARAALDGNNTGTPSNGALDHLASDDLIAAMGNLKAVVQALQRAEAAGAGNLSKLKTLLTISADAMARAEYEAARNRVGPPTRGEQRLLDRVASSLASGESLLAQRKYTAAIDAFTDALARSLNLQ